MQGEGRQEQDGPTVPREAEFDILYGTGINKLGELIDTGEKLIAHFDEHPALAQQLRAALIVQAKRVSANALAGGEPDRS